MSIFVMHHFEIFGISVGFPRRCVCGHPSLETKDIYSFVCEMHGIVVNFLALFSGLPTRMLETVILTVNAHLSETKTSSRPQTQSSTISNILATKSSESMVRLEAWPHFWYSNRVSFKLHHKNIFKKTEDFYAVVVALGGSPSATPAIWFLR